MLSSMTSVKGDVEVDVSFEIEDEVDASFEMGMK